MPVIDADTHVDETEETWEYLDEADRKFRPVSLGPSDGLKALLVDEQPHRLWLIDGGVRMRRHRDDTRTSTTRAARELSDVDARVRHMDELGVDFQVLYPTLFLNAATSRPEIEVALCKSYNRWMAEMSAKSRGRLRWVAPLPLLSIDDALKQLEFAHAHGACGVLKRGIECGDRAASDPYFFPLYEAASRLDLPICIHIGSGNPLVSEAIASRQEVAATSLLNLSILSSFTSLTVNDVPGRFPALRFGFIEAGSSWIPYLITDLLAKRRRGGSRDWDMKTDLLRRNRFYVTIDSLDDLPYILGYGAEDSLMAGTDYGHADQSADHGVFQSLRNQADGGELSPGVVAKMLNGNAATFYGL